jgi:hypothetical protein
MGLPRAEALPGVNLASARKSLARNRKSCTGVAATKERHLGFAPGRRQRSPIACPKIASDKPTGPGLAPGLPFGGNDPLPVDLSDKAIAAALNRMLDEIAETARATSPTGRLSRRLIGHMLAVRLGIPVWTGQTAAKRWRAGRGCRRGNCCPIFNLPMAT